MKNLIIVFIFSLFFSQLNGQNAYVLSGFVYDAQSGEVLIGASVQDTVSQNGTITNSYGFFSLRVSEPEKVKILFSYVGYESKIIDIDFDNKTRIDVELKPGVELETITISPGKQNIVESMETGVVRLPIREVKKLPNLFGEVDIIKAYQHTPGVQSGGEGKSEIYVRGGSPDQNLILLDDVPLYYVAHFGGFLSVFNADAISDVKLIKGGFPARYGSRLSSVLDIRMKDGNMKEYKGQGMLGLLSSKILAEGPLVQEKSSFMVSARRNTLPVFEFFGVGPKYSFYDINAKVNYRLSDKDRIYASFYTGNDVMGFEEDSEGTYMKHQTSWGNIMSALRWNRIISDKLFGNITLANTNYRYINFFENNFQSDTYSKEIKNRILTGINDVFLKADLTYDLSSQYKIRFGFNSTYHTFKPNNEEFSLKEEKEEVRDDDTETFSSDVDETYSSDVKAWEHSAYIENEWDAGWLKVNAGLRYSYFFTGNTGYASLDPRILLNIPLRHDLAMKYSFSQMKQYIHLLTYSGTGMPADYWMPSTANIDPSSSTQHSLCLAKTFGEGFYELSFETYYKTMDNLIAFKPGESLTGHLSSWENLVETGGDGYNYGAELFLQKKYGRTTGWVGITWSRAIRHFNKLNEGKAFPFKYDRPLDISIVCNYELTENLIFSITWKYGTGYPLTLTTERYVADGEEIFVYDDINSFRMRDYHRLDIAVNFPAKTSWGERNWTISVFNVYNRKNPYYYFYKRESEIPNMSGENGIYGKTGDLKLYQRSLFGFFPSFSFSFKF